MSRCLALKDHYGAVRNALGFTLIELMIVIVIVAILAMVAIPSYQEQVLRGKRADGKAFALDLASRQERFYTQNARYSDEITGLGLANDNSPEGNYVAVISECGNPCTSYTITITPQFSDPKCTTLTYSSAGIKGSTGTGTDDYCWR